MGDWKLQSPIGIIPLKHLHHLRINPTIWTKGNYYHCYLTYTQRGISIPSSNLVRYPRQFEIQKQVLMRTSALFHRVVSGYSGLHELSLMFAIVHLCMVCIKKLNVPVSKTPNSTSPSVWPNYTCRNDEVKQICRIETSHDVRKKNWRQGSIRFRFDSAQNMYISETISCSTTSLCFTRLRIMMV